MTNAGSAGHAVNLNGGFALDGVRVVPRTNTLLVKGADITLEPRLMRLLVLLASRAGDVVDRDALLGEISDASFPNDESLTQAISKLRTALGDTPKAPVFIKTIPRRGYMLVATVETAGSKTVEALKDKEEVSAEPLGSILSDPRLPFILLASLAVLLAISLFFQIEDSETEFIEKGEVDFIEKE